MSNKYQQYFFIFPIYLDYSSTCPVDPYIIEKMLPYLYYKYGNFNSKNHIFGWNSEYIINFYKKKVSNLLNCSYRELIWTSGSTESNNLSIKGVCLFYKIKKGHILTLSTKHKSVINCIKFINSNHNYDFSFINLKKNGLINFNFIYFYLKKNTFLISISLINNELGIFQNLYYITYICKKKFIILHVDGSQCLGKVILNFFELRIDLMSLSAHKNYGPKGIGLLYIRRKSNIYLNSLFHGGDNDLNLRSGTLPIHQIIGLSESYLLSYLNIFYNNFKFRNYKYIFFLELLKIDFIYLNGDFKYSVSNILNISIDHVEGESLIIAIKNLAISTGSACSSNILESSYVLKNLKKKNNFLIWK